MLILELLVSVAITLLGAAVFTNGIEWMGKKLDLSEGAVGSLLAAVGTALPETMIPIIAIFFGQDGNRSDVGVGAILGAPFLLSCFALPLAGSAIWVLSATGRREPSFRLDYAHVRTDLLYFIPAYLLLLAMSLLPIYELHIMTAVGLIIGYIVYAWRLIRSGEHGGEDLPPLYLARRSADPSSFLVWLQVVLGLAAIVGGAHLFVEAVGTIATTFGVSPLLLSLIIAPLATEMPEKLNSLIWIYQRKDMLAVGNLTGALVFQGTFPVAAGLIGTDWKLPGYALLNVILTLIVSSFYLILIYGRTGWRPGLVMMGWLAYLGYGLYLILS
jgi:cation:H+ antiporter